MRIFLKHLATITKQTQDVRRSNAGLTLVHYLRHCTIIKPTFIQRLVFVGWFSSNRDEILQALFSTDAATP